MPECASNSTPVQLLPITMPGPSDPAPAEWHSRGLCVGEGPEAFFRAGVDPDGFGNESLNAGIAASIALYEITRVRARRR